jgi:anti-sigma factor ChrR (cupin superfamily)
MTTSSKTLCEHSEVTCAYAAGALAGSEVAAELSHVVSCPACRQELTALSHVVDSFVSWPTDILCPTQSLRAKLALRIAFGTGKAAVLPSPAKWSEPEWEHVAPGTECKLLATDEEKARVSMLVRLAPGARYPAHTHAGDEELHLLDGELWIDQRKLFPGDYNYAAPGTGDKYVYSETGCTCLLVTSTNDILS